jgi:hypothetical protein
MLRIAIILTTILATTFGSLGLPIYLHTCRMVAAETARPGCPSCTSKAKQMADEHRMKGGSKCCGTSVVHQRVDAGTMSRAEMTAPVFAGIVAIVIFDLVAPLAPSAARADVGHSPPGLAALARHTYLLNSTFLI